jgi:diacylglycerol kinase (ATP)
VSLTQGTRFSNVVLIFNPNSTGDAHGLASQLQRDLAERLPGLAVELRPTAHAGHARELARTAAGHGRPLIVSVSGDGGYNEVVNGIMDAGEHHATAALEAAGNANDHRRVTKERPLLDSIERAEIVRTDLLRLRIEGPSGTRTRYAHSYIGIGLTPVVAVDLEKGTKGSLREIVTVVRTFLRFRPFAIELPEGERVMIDSVTFANLPEMAKVLKVSDNGDPDDGRFEVVLIPHRPRWRVLGTAMRAATTGLGPQPSVREYRFTALTAMPLQLDGEVEHLEAADAVTVDIAAGALDTIR